MKLLIQNGTIVDPAGGISGQKDLLLDNGVVTMIGDHLSDSSAQVIDAAGLHVSAGLIDMHVHLRDPGLTHKEDILTGSEAAAHGGFTTIACMPNTKPVMDNPDTVAYVKKRAQHNCGVHVLPIGAVSIGERGEQRTNFKDLKAAGVVALSDDGMPIMSANLMRDALLRGNRRGLTVLSHCEDDTMVHGRGVNEGRVSRALGMPGRPAIAEELMVMRDAMLAEETRTAVHICHVSTAGSVNIIRQFKRKGVRITCETCPQYFILTHEEILRQGTMAKVNPPLRATKDRDAILAAVKDGTIDCLVTDHAPHSAEEKALPLVAAPAGMVGLETALALNLTYLYHAGVLPLEEVIAKMTLRPAEVLGLGGSVGVLALGAPADVTIFDVNEEWTIDPSDFRSKGRNTPFAGMRVKGRVRFTIADGKIIYQA